MARVKDLWFSEVGVKGPDGKTVRDLHGRVVRQKRKTAKHPDRGGNKDAKRWLACWIAPDGKEDTKAFARQSEAKAYAARMEADARRGAYMDPRAARVTVAQWCETWLNGYATRRASTVRQARVHISQIDAEFGGMPLGAVRPSHIRAWCAKLRANGAAASYVYALHQRLGQIFRDAVEDGVLAKSPVSRKTSPGLGRQRPYVATTEQVWALYDAMPERLSAAILLGAFAGLRLAEACGLRVPDVDFMRGVVSPAVQYPAEPLKTEISRTPVPIARSMALRLSAHVSRFEADTVLIADGGGQLGPWALERAFRAARATVRRCAGCGTLQPRSAENFRCGRCGSTEDAEGLPGGFRYHDLRHYYASLLIADGADVKTVQARLRHASAKTTLDTYSHLWPDRDESTRATVEAVFKGRTEQGRNQSVGR